MIFYQNNSLLKCNLLLLNLRRTVKAFKPAPNELELPGKYKFFILIIYLYNFLLILLI